MAGFEIVIKRSVAKDLQAIPNADVVRILARIKSLRDDPRPSDARKLSGREHYRIRQGTYRIVYEIRHLELIVVVIKVGHRRDVYRR